MHASLRHEYLAAGPVRRPVEGGFATLVLLRRVTPEILIVGDPAGRRSLADSIAASGYGVALCSARELNRRVRTSSPPVAIIACIGDLDPDVLLAGLRRTREGASIPVILYGRLGGALRDLADVLDIGADHFIEEPTGPGEVEDALMQYAGPPRDRSRAREPSRPGDRADFDHERSSGRPLRREPERELGRGRTERLDERARPERGKALGELHRTLDRLESELRADDHRSDPELAGFGLDGIPNVDPPDEPLADDEPLLTDPGASPRGVGERPRGRPGASPLRSDFRDRRDPDEERPRPRSPRRDSTARLGRNPDDDTGPGRRSWRDDPGESDSGRSDHTRPWPRPESEGPLRRDRPPPSSVIASQAPGAELIGARPQKPSVERPAASPPDESGRTRQSAVLRAKRPDREEPGRAREPDHDAARDKLRELLRVGEPESSRGTGRYDPNARSTPWPSDFDPSESTMIRRERGDATTRRRSLADSREYPWGHGSTSEQPRARARAPELQRVRQGEPPREPQREHELRPPSPAPRRSARAKVPRPSSLQIDPSLRESGKLDADLDVPVLLWTLHEQRFTGRLRLTRQRIEKLIWLHDGEAVFARSTATSDRLVDGLLRRGVLTRPQYETARRLAAKEPRRAGELLVDAGFLKAKELDGLLRDHLARVIDSTFVWTDGAWATEPGERTDEPIQLEVPMAALILDGVRYRCDASELEDRLTRRAGGRGPLVPKLRTGAELGDLASRPGDRAELASRPGDRAELASRPGDRAELASRPGDRAELAGDAGRDKAAALATAIEELAEAFRLLPEEESWLRRFDGRHGVAALIADGADEQELFALLFTLELGGHVDLREQPEPIVRDDARDPTAVDGERILERLRLAREADYFELLGVARDASRSEIRQAHTELCATYAEEAIEEPSRRRHARELRELRAALDEARDILGDDAMRSAYLAHLGDE